MGVILLQRGRGVGLAGAFGGVGGHTTFGAKTGDFLTWVTVVGAGLFLLLAILLNYVFRPPAPAIPSTGTIQPVPAETQEPPAGAWLDPIDAAEAYARIDAACGEGPA
jgi:preprotein translocase subunit SecG